jgi:YegS/Rv2252/BmrU family lipid kinase
LTSTVDVGAPRERMLHVIVNPASGNGRAGRSWHGLAADLSQRGFNFEVRFTEKRGDATEFARAYAERGAGTILAVGGDGTVNEIVNGMLRDGAAVNSETRLAIASTGTGKDLVRTLGTRSLAGTLDALEAGHVITIDVGRITYHDVESDAPVSRYFTNVADLGLGADVARRIENASSGKAFGGLVSYLVQAVKTIRVFEGKEIRLALDGAETFEGRAQMVVFCNGRYFAGGMHIAPDASLHDGLLDIFVLEDVSRRELLSSLLPRVYLGRHVGRKGVHHFKSASAQVATPEPFLVELDGEQPGASPVDVEILPGALNVVAPAGRH